MLASAIGFLIVGFVILIYSGDCLVRGALAAALKARVSPLLVGILIVGFGTSLPEFLIGISAAQSGAVGLAHGNIIGSNIANIFLVLALPAIIFPIHTAAPRMRITAVFMLVVTGLWIGLTLLGLMSALVGMAMLAVLGVYALAAWVISRKDVSEDTPEEKKIQHMPFWRMIVLTLIGLVGLPLGSRILVDGGITLAHETGIRESVLGLTLLAVGSSLPELGAGIAAAVRKESDVAMGNILGANIFNILGVGGTVAVLAPGQQVASEFVDYSNWVMGLAALLITGVVFMQRRVGALTGIIFLLLYGAYIAGLVGNITFDSIKDMIIAPGPPPAH
ncbi:MAG TPA: calcium/sodium antiporter [Hyphomonadaceae bacterium]|nr:calcium/sodium antiporter [Hyphomonadaceae bacterium]